MVNARDDVWTSLAEEMLHRSDLRPQLRSDLEVALDQPPEAAAEAVKAALGRTVSQLHRHQTQVSAPLPSQRAAAQQTFRLVQHTLREIQHSDKAIKPRLVAHLRDQLLAYANAFDRAGSPSDLQPAERLVAQALEAVSHHKVSARPTRIGVLTPSEAAALKRGTAAADALPTVRATGDVSADLARWLREGGVDEARQRALRDGDFHDGDYLYAIVEPTDDGQRVEIHSILPTEDHAEPVVSEPIQAFRVTTRDEFVPVAEVLVSPAISEETATQIGLSTAAPPDPTDLARIRQAAVTINQARVDLYNSILSSRTDMTESGRADAERILGALDQDSHRLAGGTLSSQSLGEVLARWSHEMTRDMSRLMGRPDPDADPSQMSDLGRMGSLKHRLDSLQAAVQGIEPTARAYRGPSTGIKLVLAHSETGSVFDSLGVTGTLGDRIDGNQTAAERFSGQRMLDDAQRSEAPSSQRKSEVAHLAQANDMLTQALSNVFRMNEVGLTADPALTPLLRGDMPSNIRPNTDSPLMRSLLLPAMERVSGPSRAYASMSGESGGMTPEALFGIVLGESGRRLVERRPAAAASLLSQMGALQERLSASGGPPGLAALVTAGRSIRDHLDAMNVATPPPEGEDNDAARPGFMSAAAGAARGAGAEGPAMATVGEVSSALEGEGEQISSSLLERIAPYVDIAKDQRIFSGPVATAALKEMGAAGATVGSDIYVRQDIAQKKGSDLAAIIGHEATHVAQNRGGGRSLESKETEAYAVEAQIRDGFDINDLARADAGASEGADPDTLESTAQSDQQMIDALVELVEDRFIAARNENNFVHGLPK